MIRVDVKPDLWDWAVERAGARGAELRESFPSLRDWRTGAARPTLKQLEAFAKAALVPVGYLLLASPPQEQLPIPDLRTVGGRGPRRPSPDLLETIYLSQRRQDWYQDHARVIGEDPLDFVGSARLTNAPSRIAAQMRSRLGFGLRVQQGCATWTDALRQFMLAVEEIGVLVMVSGVVGGNNRRALDPEEFRGFALSDSLAPLIFINGADAKAAQMFTVAHELAHLWLGRSALSSIDPSPSQVVEAWCNRVAAEFLVPLTALRRALGDGVPLDSVQGLARRFRVSTLVILRRLLDAGMISRERFQAAYDDEAAEFQKRRRPGGGNFYKTQSVRLSPRFARAIITSALEGQTLYRDAYQLLGVKKHQTFEKLARSLKVLA